jgi:hypothetical protein
MIKHVMVGTQCFRWSARSRKTIACMVALPVALPHYRGTGGTTVLLLPVALPHTTGGTTALPVALVYS